MKAKIIYFLLVLILTLFIIDIPSFILLFISSNTIVMPENHWQNVIIPCIAVYFLILSLGNYLHVKIYKLITAVLLLISIPLNIMITALYLFDTFFMHYNISTNIQIENQSILNIILSYKMIMLLLLLVIPFIILWQIKPVKIKNKFISYGMACITIITIIATFSLNTSFNSVPVIQNINKFIEVSSDKKYFNKALNQYNKEHSQIDLSNIYDNDTSSIQQVYVLAIGGCQSKNHFSLYGYPRNTMPLLNELSDKLFLFKNVYTADEDRYKSLSHMITFNYNDESNGLINIIDLFKSAGFKTYWLSNHYIYEKENLYNNIVGINADEYLFMDNGYNHYNRIIQDEALISYYEKILSFKEHKKFIVVHLSGSCGGYEENYNEEYNYFYNKFANEKERIINDYDNTIVQTDYILNRLIEGLEINDSQSYMIFVSDIGADIINETDKYEIPFILWLSEEYKKVYPEIISTANDNLEKHYRADSLLSSISSLSKIYCNYSDDSKNIFSKNYKETDKNKKAEKMK